VCSGWRGNFSLEDALAAGAFVVESLRLAPGLELTESARAARDLFVRAGDSIEKQIQDTDAARRLRTLGYGEDVSLCIRRDSIPVLMEARGRPPCIAPYQPPPGPGAKRGKATVDGDAPGSPKPPPQPGPKQTGTGPSPRPSEAGMDVPPRRGRDEVDGFRMPLAEHIRELRRRIVLCLVCALLGFVGVFLFRKPVVDVVIKPVVIAFDAIQAKRLAEAKEAASNGEEKPPDVQRPKIIAVAPQEVFMAQIKISLVVGIFLASPLIFWQIWLFVASGLYVWERKWVYIFAPATYVCFASGVLFLYFVVLPLGLKFLLGFGAHPDVLPTTGYGSYTSFFLLLAVVMGVVFELPLVMLFLSKLGLVAPRTFATKRKYFIVAIFVGAAVITPPDVITQVLVALPLLVLYELGIMLGKLVYSRRSEPSPEGKAGQSP
ncbi:MAG: twin-arginine translocase subunit TatC, partial [Planctomycetota bacterium]|jgi:sec-independent protein translocase protein TatC